jgi:hypothetical protein
MDERGVPIKSDGSSGRTTRNAKRRCARRLFSKSTQLHTYTLSCASTAGSLSLSLSLTLRPSPRPHCRPRARSHTRTRWPLIRSLYLRLCFIALSLAPCSYRFLYFRREQRVPSLFCSRFTPPFTTLLLTLSLSLSLSLSLCSSRSLTLCYILFSIPRFIFCHF